MPAPRCRETGVFGDVVGNYGGSNLVHLQAAVSFWNFHPTQPQLAVHEAPDAVLQMDKIEVYKQAKGFATELQVRKYLGLMDKRDGIRRLDHDDQILLQ